MKQFLAFVGILVAIAATGFWFGVVQAAGCAPFLVASGGTGNCALKTGYIPFGAGTSPFATSTNLFENPVGSLLFTFGSTTAISGTNLAFTNATTTTFAITGTLAANCNTTNALTTNSSGTVTCTAQAQGTVTAVSIATANGFSGSSGGGSTPQLTLTTTITGILKGNGTAISAAAYTDFPTISANSVLANQSSAAAAPSSLATSSLFTYSPGLTQGSGLQKQVENRGFSYATTTAWTGTTTIQLGVAYGEFWQNMKCYTDTGTLSLDFYHASTHFPFILSASTTIGINTMNNTVDTTGDKVSVDIGTTTSTATKISCTLNDIN